MQIEVALLRIIDRLHLFLCLYPVLRVRRVTRLSNLPIT